MVVVVKDSKYRPCQQSEETREHKISARPKVVKEQYVNKYDTVCAELHFNLCKEMGEKLENKHRCDHVAISVETNLEVKVTVLWN